MNHVTPVLWSDFDGTAVETAYVFSPRSWVKYPLRKQHGYDAFLRAVQNSGVELGGVVTRRPDIWLRRIVTFRSIRKQNLSEFFGRESVVFAGSDTAKAAFVASQSRHRAVGMLEDHPERFGIQLVRYLASRNHKTHAFRSIVVGVVGKSTGHKRINALAKKVATIDDIHTQQLTPANGLLITSNSFYIQVIPLFELDTQTGAAFARTLLLPVHKQRRCS